MAKKLYNELSVREKSYASREAIEIFRKGGISSDPRARFLGMNEAMKFYFIGYALANKGAPPLEGERWFWVSNPLMAFVNAASEIERAREYMIKTHSYDPGTDMLSRKGDYDKEIPDDPG